MLNHPQPDLINLIVQLQRSESDLVNKEESQDFLLAKQLQEEWDADDRPARKSRPATFNDNDEDADEDEEDDDEEEDIDYAEDSDEEDDDDDDEPVSRPTHQRPPLPPTTAAQEHPSSLKVKLKLPATAAAQPPAPRSFPAKPTRSATPSLATNTSNLAADSSQLPEHATNEQEQEQFIEWDDDEAADAREEAIKRRKRIAPVLLSQEELEGLDDEVEKVLGHRDMQGVELDTKDPWKTREFYVKWARFSYIHCSWDSVSTLSQLGGYKRVLNYCRKVDAETAQRSALGAEEREVMDIRAALEAELEQEHSQVERVFGERLFQQEVMVEEDDDPGTGDATQIAAPGTGADKVKIVSVPQYLCKWNGLPYSEATWESSDDLQRINVVPFVEEYKKREQLAVVPKFDAEIQRRVFQRSEYAPYTGQPPYLTHAGTLRDYQVTGLNWMVFNWRRGVNCILADEMGLGKTVQCASVIGYLSTVQNIAGPFLIVVPLSTIPNWAKEFKKWIPDVNAVVYVGDGPSREVIRHFEFPTRGAVQNRRFKFDALITTYELVLKDADILRDVPWSHLMVDEAHRLKNDESALYRELSQWRFGSKLLITGTPLQNNIRELWCLMHFLHPDFFPNAEQFEAEYDLKDPAAVQRLHKALQPHLLRRVIKDVEKSLPPKNERILRVPMTPLQKRYYRWILTRNFKELNKNSRGGQVTLLNIIMDLKKCCNHPFLFESAQENYRVAPGDTNDAIATNLVVTSGKMVLLDKLLKRLKETGHRVLIFSQMVRVLDIISEYMNRRGYKHQRLDGSTPAHQRHQAMERFNAPGSEDFAFLLSTRAGGLGINLATADTVLLFDSDWNPQNDLQAMSRAHRIGQKEVVNIYRLVTSGSVEETILDRAKKKMVLDHVVIQRMDTSGRMVLDRPTDGAAAGARMFNKDELAAILKFGASDLFKEDEIAGDGVANDQGGGGGGGVMTDEDLDAILERAEVVEQKDDAPGGAGDLLSSFNVATFKGAEEDDEAFWSRLIPEDMRPEERPEVPADPGIRMARLRAIEGQMEAAARKRGGGGGGGGGSSKKKSQQQGNVPGPPIQGAALRMDVWPQAVDDQGNLAAGEKDPRPTDFPRTLGKKDAMAFIRAVKRHGLLIRLDAIAEETGGEVAAASTAARRALWYGLLRGCERAVEKHAATLPSAGVKEESTGGGDAAPPAANQAGSKASQSDSKLDFFGFEVRSNEILGFNRQMNLLENKVAGLQDPARRLRLSMAERPAPTAWMRACGWIQDDDTALLVGVYRYGIGAWDKMADDPDLRLSDKLAAASNRDTTRPELPKSSHLETRALGLLRQIEKVANRPPKPAPAQRMHHPRGGAGGAPAPTASATSGPGATTAQLSAAEAQEVKAAAMRAEQSLGLDTLVFVRKLRTLQRRGDDMDPSMVVNKTRKYMSSIGKRIQEIAKDDWKQRLVLWDYVSAYTENALSGDKLEHLFSKLSGHDEGGHGV